MINFKYLHFKISEYYSFIGIKKQKESFYFYLPKGFEEQTEKDYTFAEKRDLFFQFYKILNTFKEICIAKGDLGESSKLSTRDRDGVIKSVSGSEIQDDQDNSENIFYSKLDVIGGLLNAYDEPKILALAYRLGKSDKFDVSKIHRHLHQAIYLPNNAAYIDQMTLPKKVIQFESTDIVAMYCYLFCEVKQQLKESVSPEIISLAESFRQHYLGSQDSIFDEQTYEQTLDILKDALEIIDHNTSIKDTDYWQYYEAIELFLYGDFNQSEDGEIWGISNFHSVWESMCLTYLAQNIDSFLLLKLDAEYLSPRLSARVESSVKAIDLSNVFQINNSELKPDATIYGSLSNRIKVQETYQIKIPSLNWNDAGYTTTVKGLEIEEKNVKWKDSVYHPRIAYIGQPCNLHTIKELEKHYPKDRLNRIFINKPLPANFYSFWLVAKEFDSNYLHKMYFFNHFFYLAMKKNATDWNEFNEKILKPIGANFDRNKGGSKNNVFTKSIFNYSQEKIKEHFDLFMQRVFSFEIIDIKYLTSQYFCNSDNIQEIKRRSIRKQFTYEYLLQKKLVKEYWKDSKFTIHSSFWLPSYRPNDSNLIEDGSTFMDDYIQLKNVNFQVLADNYVM